MKKIEEQHFRSVLEPSAVLIENHSQLLSWKISVLESILYHFELFGMACDPWPPRRNFASADASGTRDIDEFQLSACSNFGRLFSRFWNFFVTYMSRLANVSVTRNHNRFRRRQEGPWPVTCRTIRNGTVLTAAASKVPSKTSREPLGLEG